MIRVLIVEDEEIIRKGIMHAIDWMAMDCIVVGEGSDGEEGLRLIEQLRPDLVITDVKMPMLNGIDMLKEASAIHSFQSIILTSFSEFDYARQAVSLGVSEYILKPVDESELAAIIENVKRKIKQNQICDGIAEKNESQGSLQLVDLDGYLYSGRRSNYYVNEALTQIKHNYHSKTSIELIANNLGVSPSYLSRKFREETSCTFLDILNRYRVQKAIELLKTGKYRVYEVSDMTGFNEYKHFCHIFKKYTGTSPSNFIKFSYRIVVNNAPEK